MGYGREIYREALENVRRYRLEAERARDDARAKAAEKCPNLAEIDRRLSSLAVNAAKSAALGRPIGDLKQQTEQLRAEKAVILARLGIDPAALEPKYRCVRCGDTGYVDGLLCICVQRVARDIAYKKLCGTAPLEQSDFASFSLAYYPDKTSADGVNPGKIMTDNFMFSMEYASSFAPGVKSVLFMGPTGLGKTHLSLAIAKAVLDKGYGVIYGSVQNLIGAVEKEHFGKSGSEGALDSLLECDLLILDDLGTEFSTPFSLSVIYNIINTRMLSSKATVISTNLSLKELEKKYGERILSRIAGNYHIKTFCGEDIRKIKAFG